MAHYLISFMHVYIAHVGAWGAYIGFTCIKDKNSIKVKDLILISFLLAFFSALAHNHYMQFLK